MVVPRLERAIDQVLQVAGHGGDDRLDSLPLCGRSFEEDGLIFQMPERKPSKYPNEFGPNTRTVDAICEIVYAVFRL